MTTNFGKFCRRLRINSGELLYDMAGKLGVSSAFLSKVENGKKKPPVEWRDKIIMLYQLNNNEIKELDECLFEARNYDSIDISNYGMNDKELMWSFARKFNSLDRERLKDFLNEEEEM